MIDTIARINGTLNGIVWGLPATVLIFGVGLYLSIRTGFLQFTKFGTVWKIPSVRYSTAPPRPATAP